MPSATAPYCNRIAIAFDYDDTLAPNGLVTLLDSLGVSREEFERKYTRPLEDDGWDSTLARFYGLIQLSHDLGEGRAITRDHLKQVGRETEFFDGVPEMFDQLREAARRTAPDGVEVEFYSNGSELMRSLRLAVESIGKASPSAR